MTDRRTAYERDGFLLLEGFFDGASCDALIARAAEIVAGFSARQVPAGPLAAARLATASRSGIGDPFGESPEGFRPETYSVFTTHEQTRRTDDYFLGSGDQIRCFFEEEAFGPDGALQRPVAQSINKIGHALHDLDPVFARFSRDPRIAALAAELGLEAPLLLQSMYIFKQPFIGGEVEPHQDHTFLWTDPPSATGFWFALEDATLENGCMWAVPGGHREPPRKRFRRTGPGTAGYEVFDDRPLPDTGMVPLVAPKGTCVVLHGLLPHASGANRSPISRQAYSVHVIEAAAAYRADNWLQRGPAMPLRGF